MSRFDELTPLFDAWRNNWVEQYHQHQLLAPRIAKRVQEFLGCPEDFPSDDGTKIKYVSPTHAKWDDETADFTLVAYKNPFEDVDFRDDGYFYFGLRIYLEHGPRTYPKEAFWFLFRGKQESNSFTVWVERSKRQFNLDTDAGSEIESLCEHLFDLLKADLVASPISRAAKEPFRIGFLA